MREVRTCSATARSTGRPSADSSAQSSSAVDSERAVARAIGRPSSAASASCCCPATSRARAAQRAIRPGLSDQPPLTHSGRRCPSGATGSLASPSSPPNRSEPNKSSGPPAGTVSVARPRSRAQAKPGSARQPPNSSRCTAAISQHVASRTPAAASRAAVWPDQSTHRGRSSSSALLTSAATPGTAHERSPAASPNSSAGETTSATRSPRFTPACRSDVTRSAPATDPTLPRTRRRHRRGRSAAAAITGI